MLYKYETHLHTSQGSACAKSTGAELVDFYKAHGYSGFAVTDHFMNGNTAVNRELPWEAQVDEFCTGYEDAERRGREVNFNVFFGFEFNYKGTEFLIFGLDKEWLKSNEIIIKVKLKTALQTIKKAGGTIVHAHPFRMAPYIKVVRLIPELTDVVEVKNGGNMYTRHSIIRENRQDELAAIYAGMLGKPAISGSDIHSAWESSNITGGISTEFPLTTVHEFANVIKNGNCFLL